MLDPKIEKRVRLLENYYLNHGTLDGMPISYKKWIAHHRRYLAETGCYQARLALIGIFLYTDPNKANLAKIREILEKQLSIPKDLEDWCEEVYSNPNTQKYARFLRLLGIKQTKL